MPPEIGYATPFLIVADIARSLRFYRTLGFEIVDVDGDEECIGWARVHCEGGAIMFLLAEDAGPKPTVMLALYTPDLEGLRSHLLAAGLTPAPIHYPEYMPSGEMRIDDPDGNVVLVNQWSRSEQEPWEEVRKARLERFGFS